MAKGQTNQPLNIRIIDEALFNTPEVQALITAGHTVEYKPLGEVDVLLGPLARYMTHDMLKHLPTTIKAVRADKRKKKGSK